jgi:hypothetical protein
MSSRRSCHVRHSQLLGALSALGLLAALAGSQPASAAEPPCQSPSGAACAPFWRLSSRSAPTYLPLKGEQLVGEGDEAVKGEGMILATASNLGDANVTPGPGERITVTDELPPGVQPVSVVGTSGLGVPGGKGGPVEMSCPKSFKEGERLVSCTFDKTNLEGLEEGKRKATCEAIATTHPCGSIPPFEHLQLQIAVKIMLEQPPNPLPENKVTVSQGEPGKETLKETIEAPLKIVGATANKDGKPPDATRFGVESYELTPESETGRVETQAGAHPYQLTSTFNLNETYGPVPTFKKPLPKSPALQKELSFKIPAGLLGNPNAVPQCSDIAFGTIGEHVNFCPDADAVGVATVTFNEPNTLSFATWSVPVFNITPAPGEPARFGFEIDHVPIVLDTSVRTGEDYGATVTVKNTSSAVHVLGAEVTLWGVPGDPSHDNSRGWSCVGNGHWVELATPRPECVHGEFERPPFEHPKPFLLLPTSCAEHEPLESSVTGEAWSGERLQGSNQTQPPVSLTGCEKLQFDPSLAVKPDQSSASTPTGMTVEVTMPQEETTLALPPALGEADIKDTTLVLPAGVAANAGAAIGLATCGIGETGFFGSATDSGEELAKELEAQRFSSEPATCPDAAKIAEVEVNTPLLPRPVTGGLYLGVQDTNPFASPVVLYLIATEEEPINHEGSKVVIKLAGEVNICSQTENGPCAGKQLGQLISVFKNTPQAPFERLRIHLFEGETDSQATPSHCGPYTAIAKMVPWSGGKEQVAESSFQVTSGPGGGPCPGSALPFVPSLSAGPTNTKAGAFTEFDLDIDHPDGSQALNGLSMRLPQGAAAMLASVTPCPIAQADVGACTEASEIGTTEASSGLGETPLTLPGRAYLTEGFAGAPFGISVATPADLRAVGPSKVEIGPFNIGTIIANSTITVDPYTAAGTVTAAQAFIHEPDPGGEPPGREPEGRVVALDAPLPTMIKGVPVELKAIHVKINRPSFEFNPTRCTGTSITGAPIAIADTLTGAEGGSASQLTPYPVTGCESLAFTPKLTASVSGQGSKENGVTFAVTVESHFGLANIAKTFLALPIALPSRLTTIQKACLVATFELTFPPGQKCEAGSHIGEATARTPVLKHPLKGPAYLISHGNAGFPDVEFVLQGEGITVVLDGKTDVKKGITYSRFETVPDAPVEKFETVFPAGPHSALTANVPESEHFNLCKHGRELVIPTEITGQNGTVLKQQTQIQLLGCGGVLCSAETNRKASNARLLRCALAACRKKYKGGSKATKQKRASCEANARKKFGPRKKKTKHKKH